jgi:hypothetical protein
MMLFKVPTIICPNWKEFGHVIVSQIKDRKKKLFVQIEKNLTFSECVSVRINSLYFKEIIDWQKKKLCWRIPIELISNFLHNNIFWIICFHIDLFLICACSHLIRYMIRLQLVYISCKTPTTFFQTNHWIYFPTHGSYISNDWF